MVRLATTTSTEASGLTHKLVPLFERTTGYRVQVISEGSGQAIELCRRGAADVLLAHAREAEDDFVLAGYGTNRHDVMYNDFVLLGPPDDPAGVRDASGVVEALQRIESKRARYVSRADHSGTHLRERSLLQLAKVELDPVWYTTSERGMLETLAFAAAQSAYVLSERAFFLSNAEAIDLQVLLEGDLLLYNPYGVTAVNPLRAPGVNFKGAMAFINFITGEQAQRTIAAFGVERFGRPLFVPLALQPEVEAVQ